MTRTVEQTIVDEHGIIISWALRTLQVPSAHQEDGFQGGVVGLVKASARFDADKGTFRSFAASYVLEEVRRAVGWDRRTRLKTIPLDHRHPANATTRRRTHDRPMHWFDPVFDEAARDEAIAAVVAFVGTLNDEERYIYCRLYIDGATQSAVAAELGMNKMTMSRRAARFHSLASLALADYAAAA
jgi:RNA polymerase sigma factor (sigma-70 family)